jgi:hypothetical protein
MFRSKSWLPPAVGGEAPSPASGPMIASATGGCSLLPSDWSIEPGCGSWLSCCGRLLHRPIHSGGSFTSFQVSLAVAGPGKAGELLFPRHVSWRMSALEMT